MATKVYLSGDVVKVVNPLYSDLNIPQSRAKYTFIASSPTESNPVPDFTSVRITDVATNEYRTDLISNIQNSIGTYIGDYDDVFAYFKTFMIRGDFEIIPSDLEVIVTGGATAENQETQIQNDGLAASFSQNESSNILKELKEIKKLLTKIYQ